MFAFEQDLARGMPWEQLATEHYEFLLPWDRDALLQWMLMLHEAKLGPLGSKAASPDASP